MGVCSTPLTTNAKPARPAGAGCTTKLSDASVAEPPLDPDEPVEAPPEEVAPDALPPEVLPPTTTAPDEDPPDPRPDGAPDDPLAAAPPLDPASPESDTGAPVDTPTFPPQARNVAQAPTSNLPTCLTVTFLSLAPCRPLVTWPSRQEIVSDGRLAFATRRRSRALGEPGRDARKRKSYRPSVPDGRAHEKPLRSSSGARRRHRPGQRALRMRKGRS
jgi:hypothetical protein